ncbi:MAG TPA: MIP family channel protein [Bacteroidota bacterium]|nr:MIP family channel protein [Bacteroidota bacterium]
MPKINVLVAEFVGTFTLIFIGVSSICANGIAGGFGGPVGIALAHGLAIGVMVAALGHISGGHFNPAVTFGAIVGKKIEPMTGVFYMVAQLIGAVVGALAVISIFPAAMYNSVKLGTPALGQFINPASGLLMEIIMTFFLVLVVFGSAMDKRASKLGPLFIGLTITIDILAGGPITGAAMNPARAFGPALVGGFWEDHYIYWAGPLIGGALAGLLYSRLFDEAK